MAITYTPDEEGLYPLIECDWCGQQIGDVEQGNVYWWPEDPSTLYFNHKGCADAHETALDQAAALARGAETPGDIMYSEHLEVFLALLLGNTGRPEALPLVDRDRLYKTRY